MDKELIALKEEVFILPDIKVTPGSLTNDYSELRDKMSMKLNALKNWEITEDEFKDAKDIRAKANKVKDGIKAQFQSVKREYLQPLVEWEKSYKETIALLENVDSSMGKQIDVFTDKRRSAKFAERMKIYEEVFNEATETEREFAKQCEWICKPEWGNATYSEKKVREDCERAAFEVKSALALLTGEFAPQMLAVFRQSGSISEAQLEGKKLEKAREEYRNYLASQAPMPDQSSQAMNTIKVDSEPYTVNPPTLFRKTEEDDRIGSVDMRFRGKLYQIKWLRSICKAEGIELEFIKEK